EERGSARGVADPHITAKVDPAGTADPKPPRSQKTGTEMVTAVAQPQVDRAQAHIGQVLCPGRDLNPYKLALTAPSKLRVYQFHHPGEGDAILPQPRACNKRRKPASLWWDAVAQPPRLM